MADSTAAEKAGACFPGASPPETFFLLSVIKLEVQMGCQSCVLGGCLLQLYRSSTSLWDPKGRRGGLHPVFYPESLSGGGTSH